MSATPSPRETFNLLPEIENSMAFTQAIKTGDTIYVSGTVGIDENGKFVSPNSMEAQLLQIYANIEKTLAHFGASLDHVVAETVYVIDIEDYRRIGIKRRIYANRTPPTSTAIQISALAFPELLAEISAVARL
jgi:2-iminobutanoate/2-iminopropanoate deaminase